MKTFIERGHNKCGLCHRQYYSLTEMALSAGLAKTAMDSRRRLVVQLAHFAVTSMFLVTFALLWPRLGVNAIGSVIEEDLMIVLGPLSLIHFGQTLPLKGFDEAYRSLHKVRAPSAIRADMSYALRFVYMCCGYTDLIQSEGSHCQCFPHQ